MRGNAHARTRTCACLATHVSDITGVAAAPYRYGCGDVSEAFCAEIDGCEWSDVECVVKAEKKKENKKAQKKKSKKKQKKKMSKKNKSTNNKAKQKKGKKKAKKKAAKGGM